MLDSLRARLLLWYALILALIVLIFAATVCYLFWRSLVQDIDSDLQSTAATLVQALRPAASGDFDFDLPRQYRDAEFTNQAPRTYYAVFNRQGDLVDRSDPDVPTRGSFTLGTDTRFDQRELTVSAANGAVVIVGRDLGEARNQVIGLARRVTAAGTMVLLLSSLGGWFLAGRALGPVSRISRVAMAMSGGDLSARIPVEQTENELEQLASTLNEAFDRLRLVADVQRRFTADASHELRTPLATIVAEFDWALARPRLAAEYRQTIDTCRRASDRMRRVVDELLTLARNDNGAQKRRREPVDLAFAIRDCASRLQSLSDQQHVKIETHLAAAAWMVADPDRISELVMNLLKNALDYSHDGGKVTMEVHADDGGVHLRVSDVGIGIAADDLPHVFNRFYRADKARSRDTGGAGLGLAIAKRIVEEHEGEITCHSELGKGTVIAVRFPGSVSLSAAHSDG